MKMAISPSDLDSVRKTLFALLPDDMTRRQQLNTAGAINNGVAHIGYQLNLALEDDEQ